MTDPARDPRQSPSCVGMLVMAIIEAVLVTQAGVTLKVIDHLGVDTVASVGVLLAVLTRIRGSR